MNREPVMDASPISDVTKRLSAEGARGGVVSLPPEEAGSDGAEEGREEGKEQEPRNLATGDEGGDEGGEGEGEDEFAFDLDGKKYRKDDIEKALRDHGSVAQKEARLREVGERLQRDAANLERMHSRFQQERDAFYERLERGGGRREAEEPEYEPDAAMTYGDFAKLSARQAESLEKKVSGIIQKELQQRDQRLASSQAMDSVEDMIEEHVERTEFLKASDKWARRFKQLAIADIFEREDELARMPRREAMKAIRRVMLDVDADLREARQEQKIARAEEKGDLARRSRPLPKGGTPAQPAKPKIESISDFQGELRRLRQNVSKRFAS